MLLHLSIEHSVWNQLHAHAPVTQYAVGASAVCTCTVSACVLRNGSARRLYPHHVKEQGCDCARSMYIARISVSDFE